MNQKKTTVTSIKASTQTFLEISDIKEGIVILKDGSCVIVLSTTAINFGLLSEGEQDASIYSYGALLNSLTFPIQILIRSKRKDVTSYLNLLAEQEKKVTKKLIKEQIQKYRKFIENTVQANNVLEKKFYVVIPMSSLEIGIAKNVGPKFKKQKNLPYPKDYILKKAKTNLFPKRDHLFRLLNRLGLRSRQLSTRELVKLFFTIYNPATTGQILSEPKDYQTPLVKPATDFLQAPPADKTPNSPIPAEDKPLSVKAEKVIQEKDETAQDKIDQQIKETTKPIFDSSAKNV